MAGILSLASAVNISGSSRVALSIFTGLFALFAFVLNFFQMRFGWSSRAEVHRSVEMELAQVAFQLDTLRRYDNGQLCSSSVSYKARSSAIRDLYRIEVYLQAVMKCTPQVPDRINEAFSLLASRLKSICLKYPHAVKLRLANGAYDDEQSDPTNPVPVDMQSDALEVLGKEIRNYYLFPMFMPKPVDVVSRTIDLFFAKPPRTEHKDDTIYEEEYSEYSDEEEDDHKYSQNDIV